MASASDGNGNLIINESGDGQESIMTTNKANISMNDSQSSVLSVGNEKGSEKWMQFEMQMSKLESAKGELLSEMRVEREIMVKQHAEDMLKWKQEREMMEKSMKEQMEAMIKERKEWEDKVKMEMEEWSEKLKKADLELKNVKSDSHKEKIGLESVIREKENDLAKIQMEKNEMESKLKSEISKCESECEKVKRELVDVTHSKEKALQDMSHMNDRLITIDKELKLLVEDLNKEKNINVTLEMNLDEADNKLKQVSHELELERKEKEKKMKEVQTLVETLGEHELEMVRLKKLLEKAEKLYEECDEEKSQLSEEYIKIKETIKELEKCKFDLKRELSNERINSSSFESEVKVKEKRIKEIQENLRAQEEEASLMINSLNSKLFESESSKARLKHDVNSLKQQVDELEVLLKTEKERNQTIQAKHDALMKDVDMIKHAREMEKKDRLDKLNLNKSLTEQLNESNSEVDQLRRTVEELDKSRQEYEQGRSALLHDCSELRNTLKEVEKSRVDIRKDLNNLRYHCTSLENELKLKNNAIQELQVLNGKKEEERQMELTCIKNKLIDCESAKESLRLEVNSVRKHASDLENLLKEERNNLNKSESEMKRIYDTMISLQSTRQMLSQLKDKNNQLAMQNKQLQAQISLSETKRRDIEKKLNSSSLTMGERDSELNELRSEVASLKAINSKLETDRRRLERCFAEVDKEKQTLKNTLEDVQRKSYSPMPDSSSIKSSKSNKSNKSINNNKSKDGLIDEAKIISQGLAALELRNVELQKKVEELQTLMDDSSCKNEVNHIVTSINGDLSMHNNSTHNFSKHNSDPQRLRSAQKQAQELLADAKERRSHNSHNHNHNHNHNKLHSSVSDLERELSSIKDHLTTSPSFSTTPSRFKELPKHYSSSSTSNIGHQAIPSTSTPLLTFSSPTVKRKLDWH